MLYAACCCTTYKPEDTHKCANVHSHTHKYTDISPNTEQYFYSQIFSELTLVLRSDMDLMPERRPLPKWKTENGTAVCTGVETLSHNPSSLGRLAICRWEASKRSSCFTNNSNSKWLVGVRVKRTSQSAMCPSLNPFDRARDASQQIWRMVEPEGNTRVQTKYFESTLEVSAPEPSCVWLD